jgi:hypothetical protein
MFSQKSTWRSAVTEKMVRKNYAFPSMDANRLERMSAKYQWSETAMIRMAVRFLEMAEGSVGDKSWIILKNPTTGEEQRIPYMPLA